MQKMTLKLLKCSTEIKYLSGKDMFLADIISRVFIRDGMIDDPDMLCAVHSASKYLPVSDRRVNQFKNTLQSDEELKLVVNYCNEAAKPKENHSKLKKVS